MSASAKLIPIITVPDPILRQVASPVGEITDGIRQLLDDMAATMYDAPGIGLAAPQINISKRLIVMDCGKDDTPELFKMVNPEIVGRSDARAILEEGCLSIPDHTADVERPAEVEIRYLDEDGIDRSLSASGLLAACVQHEIDHLNGVLFIDHISRLKRDMILRRVMKDMRQSGKAGA
ncbi:MAG: peptide deformylase [Candidatus Puniceispirillum sp.]